MITSFTLFTVCLGFVASTTTLFIHAFDSNRSHSTWGDVCMLLLAAASASLLVIYLGQNHPMRGVEWVHYAYLVGSGLYLVLGWAGAISHACSTGYEHPRFTISKGLPYIVIYLVSSFAL